MAEEERKTTNEIVERDYDTPNHRWTFLKYVKSIAHFKWWIIGFSVGGLVAGYLGTRLILNPMQKKLGATYSFDLAGSYDSGDTDTISFIDGSTFNSYDLTGRENIQKIKDGDEKYNGVDIDKIVVENAITVTKNVSYYNENDPNSVNVSYSISANTSYFPNDEVGKSFIYDLINLPKSISSAAINNYNAISYFTDNFETLSFDRQISQINDQYNSNNAVLNSLSTTFGSTVVGNSEGNKIYEIQNKYTSKYLTSSTQTFVQELVSVKNVNKFVNYVVGEEDTMISKIHEQSSAYIDTLKQNEKKIAIYETSLNSLLSSASIIGSDTNVSSQIAQLNKDITSLKLENNEYVKLLNNNGYFYNDLTGEYEFDPLNTDTIVYKLTIKDSDWINSCNEFKNRITSYKNSLEQDRQTVTGVYSYCYAQYKNRVNIQNGGYIEVSGSFSNMAGAALGLLAGFAITSLITATIYVYKTKEE